MYIYIYTNTFVRTLPDRIVTKIFKDVYNLLYHPSLSPVLLCFSLFLFPSPPSPRSLFLFHANLSLRMSFKTYHGTRFWFWFQHAPVGVLFSLAPLPSSLLSEWTGGLQCTDGTVDLLSLPSLLSTFIFCLGDLPPNGPFCEQNLSGFLRSFISILQISSSRPL